MISRPALLAALVLAATPAPAQQPQLAPPGPRTYTLTLTPQDLAVLSAAIGKLPLETALSTFQRIDAQIGEQNKRHQQVDRDSQAPKTGDKPADAPGKPN